VTVIQITQNTFMHMNYYQSGSGDVYSINIVEMTLGTHYHHHNSRTQDMNLLAVICTESNVSEYKPQQMYFLAF
jgi:hypothetical protein